MSEKRAKERRKWSRDRKSNSDKEWRRITSGKRQFTWLIRKDCKVIEREDGEFECLKRDPRYLNKADISTKI